MAEQQQQAAQGGFDYEALGKTIATSVSAAMAESQKVLAETIAKLAASVPPAPVQAAAAPAPAAKEKSVTADDVTRIVTESLKGFAANQQQATARNDFLGSRLKDLPSIYRGQLGSDPSKWDAEEQSIRKNYRDDLAAQGLKAPEVSGGQPSGATATRVVDYSKLSPRDLVVEGLKQSTPKGPGSARGARVHPEVTRILASAAVGA